LLSLIEFLHQEASWDNYFTEQNLVGIKRMLASVINIYEKQIEHKTLTKNQGKVLQIFNNVDKLMRETSLKNIKDGKSFTVWDLLEGKAESLSGKENIYRNNAYRGCKAMFC
jgi:hypothetical protein